MTKGLWGMLIVATFAMGCANKVDNGSAASTATTPASPATTNANAANAAAAGAAAATPGYRWETHPGLRMKFEIPNDWSAAPNGNVLVIKTPTPGVGVEFVAVSGEVAAKSDEKLMLTEVGKSLKNAKFTSPLKPAAQHGLKGFVANGNGSKNGATVDWFTAALGSGDKALLALGFYSPDAPSTYKSQLVHVLDSIQPM